MATLSASDAFLLPYSDGVSLRRGSFQAVAQLAIPLVTTVPERPDEFDAMPSSAAGDPEGTNSEMLDVDDLEEL